jgi:anaphase-promoting complex subunit 12
MIRRDPTRIELKLEDIQEYEQMKRKMEEEKKQKSNGSPMEASGAIAPDADQHVTSKTRTEIIHERIGYDPAPKI